MTTPIDYTCPMHPEIIQKGPGNCPKCGMTLEPLKTNIIDLENHELIDMTRRFWACLVLSLIVVILTMGPMISGVFPEDSPVLSWAGLILTTPVVLWGYLPHRTTSHKILCERGAEGF